MDPPYWQTEGYGVDFAFENYEKMAYLMQTMKGKAMLSINDHPDIRECFKDFEFEVADISYTCGKEKPAERKELIIYSWDRSKEPVGLF